VDSGVAPTYVGDELLITRSDAEIRRRNAGIHSPSASVMGETLVNGSAPVDAPRLLTLAIEL